MTNNEATKILQSDLTYTYSASFDDLQKAVNLGAEALKRIEYCRSGHFNELFKLLPGETEE
jgi:hypothetical protein